MVIKKLIMDIHEYLNNPKKERDDHKFSNFILDEYMQGVKMEKIKNESLEIAIYFVDKIQDTLCMTEPNLDGITPGFKEELIKNLNELERMYNELN